MMTEFSREKSVLFVVSTLIVAGSEQKTVRVVNALKRRGWNVHLAYLNPPETLLPELDRDVAVTCLDRRGKFSFKAARNLRNYISANSIAQVKCINLYPVLYVFAAFGFRRSRNRPPVTLMINTTEHANMLEKLQMVLYRPLMKRIERIVFGCKAQLELWRERYKLDDKKCFVIYNGVDTKRFSPRETGRDSSSLHDLGIAIGDKDFIVAAVGKFRREKNHVELVDAISRVRRRVPDAKLVLVGEGEELERIVARIDQHGLGDSVFLPGRLGDVRAVLSVTDVYVQPSISETFSNAALEAMAMAKPVILSDTGGTREMVDAGSTGYYYSSGDLDALTERLEWLAANPGPRLELGRQARQTVERRFSFDAMVDAYEREIRQQLC